MAMAGLVPAICIFCMSGRRSAAAIGGVCYCALAPLAGRGRSDSRLTFGDAVGDVV